MALETKGSDINFRNANGETALWHCDDPDLVRLYLSHGADLSVVPKSNLLEGAILLALSNEESSQRGLELARAYAEHGINSIAYTHFEYAPISRCHDDRGITISKGWLGDVCKSLAKIIKTSPGVFGPVVEKR